MAEKTEKATPKKIRDARKKGQVAKSQDFPSAFTFVVSIAATILLAKNIYQQLAAYMIETFSRSASDPNMQNMAGGYIMQAIMVIFSCSMPILVLTVIMGILVNMIIIGPLFSLEVITPKLEKLNPVTNLKNLFKFKTVFELLKSILKLTGAFIILYLVIKSAFGDIIATVTLPMIGILQVFNTFLIKAMIHVGIFFIAVAIFDLVYQKKNFAKEMKMEKFEVKQEYKDTEGDPHIKNRRRQTAQEIAYQEGPQAIKRAKAIITNPIHIAVAIEYEEEKQPAPKIIIMGQGILADIITKEALSYNIPIMRNVPLAHTLFEKGKIGQYIPEETYHAVAEILRWLKSLEEAETEVPEIFKT